MLRSGSTLSAALAAVILAGVARADEAKDARAVIDRAIKATYDDKDLGKPVAITWSAEGTYHGMGSAQPFTASYAVEPPDRFRMEITGVLLVVFNGSKGWVRVNGETRELDKEGLAEAREAGYAAGVTALAALKRHKGFKLSLLGESKVDGHSVVGVKVAHPGHRDVKLYIGKKTGLLRKAETRVKSREEGGKEVIQETLHHRYQDVAGIKFPRKVTIKRDGQPYVEATYSDVKISAPLPEKEFQQP
jgi:hypothetical protein